jgi:tripartite-type tricarboxylate transporter receptor subunit TctC
MPMRSFKLPLCALLAALTFGAAVSDALAQTKLPGKPIRLLVPFAPGGGVDVGGPRHRPEAQRADRPAGAE